MTTRRMVVVIVLAPFVLMGLLYAAGQTACHYSRAGVHSLR